MEKIKCRIKEHSWLARRAAQKMDSPQMAMVLGCTIHLYGVSRQEFLQSVRWVRHEVCHIKQFRHYGVLRFLWLYLLEYRRRGYMNNRFEVAARAAEREPGIMEGIEIV